MSIDSHSDLEVTDTLFFAGAIVSICLLGGVLLLAIQAGIVAAV